VAGWPGLGRVEDRRLAQSLRAGDPVALPEIYDIYAPRLFDYCHALLRDEDLAADALHDSLIATQEHIAKLREPERFRSWLYAILRNECLRQLADRERSEQRHEAPEEAGNAFLDADERRRREETRQLVLSALAGLTARHREAVDLAARHDLSAEEIAGILGISSQQATELVAQARDDLDNSLAAAIIARTGRGDCPSVAALVDEQEWPLPPDVCRKLMRHIESCPTCRDRRKRKVSTNRLMQVLPVAAIPSDLRMAVLSLAEAPDQHQSRTRIAQRAEPFDVWGWPTSLDRVRPGVRGEGGSGTPRLWPALGAAACVLLVVGAIFLLTGGSSGTEPATDTRSQGAAGAPSEGPSDIPSPSDSVTPTPKKTTPTPSPTPTTHTPTPVPSTTRPRSTPSRTRKPTKKPVPPTLLISSCTMGEQETTCPISLTAKGGPVHWRVTGTDNVSASGSDTLKSGETTTVTATRRTPCTPGDSGSVSFSPGGTASVTWKCGVLSP
jgi:RNA polymerase sigma factor (sigma-70 family)